MKIYVAENSGFCKGVEYAVNTALSLDPDNAYILGEIIHNAEVIKAIGEHGLKVVENLNEIPDNSTVVFRSHGVPRSFYGECENRGIKVIDCTCGFVKHTQRIVAEQSAKGNTIVIAGEPTHPEVIGLLGWCNGNAIVVNDENKIPVELADKNICIVSQTTFSAIKFEKIIKNIKNSVKNSCCFQDDLLYYYRTAKRNGKTCQNVRSNACCRRIEQQQHKQTV